MKHDTPASEERMEDLNKVPGTLWDTFHNFGEIGEYRVLAQTDECVVIRLENETGEGDMILYQVFDGIILMYNDFHMSQYHSMYQAADTMLAVDYCREGSLTMEWDNGMYCMKKAGSVCIDSRVHHKGMTYFPTNHYHGITIGFVSSLSEKALEENAAGIPIDLAAIRKKFCGDDEYFIIQEDETLKRLFTDLYRVPENARLPYFRTKVLELLVCLSVMEAKDVKDGGTYFYKDKVEKTRAVQKLISGMRSANCSSTTSTPRLAVYFPPSAMRFKIQQTDRLVKWLAWSALLLRTSTRFQKPSPRSHPA